MPTTPFLNPVVIIGFMLYLAFYDVQDLGKERRANVTFAPKAADKN